MTYPTSQVLRRLRQAALGSHGGGLSDGQLLRTFLDNHDECAFEALVRRHGPMVLGVCRRVLRNAHDAEDAFQAAFLVLVRKAASLAGREVVGDWLHGVAYRTALKARTAQARRRGKERRMARPEAVAADLPSEWHELLDQELHGLPEKYRVPIILCELEGRTHQEAARQLGCPVGTLSGRLSRARTLLAHRLTRRGLTLSTGALSAALASQATAAGVSPALVGSIVKAATLIAAGQAAAGIVSAHVAALTEGVVRAMLLTKLKTLGMVGLAIAFLGAGTGAVRLTAAADEKEAPPNASTREPAKPAPKVPEPIPDRQFEIALHVTEVKNGQTKVLAEPKLRTLDGKQGCMLVGGGEQLVKLHDKLISFAFGLKVRTAVASDSEGRLDIDMTVSRDSVNLMPGSRGGLVNEESARLLQEIELDKPINLELKSKDKDASTIQVTATVSEVTKGGTIASAEKDLKTAESYRRTGKRASALHMYGLILRRYPDTLYAKQAENMIAELSDAKKPTLPPLPKGGYRVGDIRIINNTKTKDSVILENVHLYPGHSFTSADLRKAEEELPKRIKFAKPVKVSVGYSSGDGDYRLITVRVEE